MDTLPRWLSVAVLLTLVSGDEPPAEVPSPETLLQLTTRLIELHNQVREREDLPPLQRNAKLDAAARRHARDMAERQKMEHTGRDGATIIRRAREAGYRYRRVGENIAFGDRTAEAVMKRWLDSPPHKVNVLGAFSQIGAACQCAKDGTPYWCVTFGTPFGRDSAARAKIPGKTH